MESNLLITQLLCPSTKYSIKCPYEMTPEGISMHNTANDASAMNEISYMISNSNQVSFHFAVDDYRAVQGILLTRNTWHAGDGASGFGNRKTIAIEICYSKSGGDLFTKSEVNAAILAAKLCKEYGWDTSKIGTHQDRSGKNCPHRTLDLGFERWLKLVETYLEEDFEEVENKVEDVTTTKHAVGDSVKFTGLATASNASSHSTKILVTSGKITRIVEGAKYPYLINGGTGWINDALISTTTTTTSTSTSSSTSTSHKVGDTVTLLSTATKYATGETIPSGYKNKKYTIQQLGTNKVLLKELYSWVYTSDIK